MHHIGGGVAPSITELQNRGGQNPAQEYHVKGSCDPHPPTQTASSRPLRDPLKGGTLPCTRKDCLAIDPCRPSTSWLRSVAGQQPVAQASPAFASGRLQGASNTANHPQTWLGGCHFEHRHSLVWQSGRPHRRGLCHVRQRPRTWLDTNSRLLSLIPRDPSNPKTSF